MPATPTSSSAPSQIPLPSSSSSVPQISNNNDNDEEMVDGFQDENITIGFIVKQIGDGSATLISKVLNISNNPITNMNVLCAVSKQQKLQLSPISSNFIQPKNSSIINLKINGKIGSKVKLRVKISYDINGETKNNQFDFSGLKETL
ncbi:hypothetical protein B5S32_g5728 [[Candida] boidinii]|nr:hypothetical protein B5S32_g5728 [[Candida] boidinii]